MSASDSTTPVPVFQPLGIRGKIGSPILPTGKPPRSPSPSLVKLLNKWVPKPIPSDRMSKELVSVINAAGTKDFMKVADSASHETFNEVKRIEEDYFDFLAANNEAPKTVDNETHLTDRMESEYLMDPTAGTGVAMDREDWLRMKALIHYREHDNGLNKVQVAPTLNPVAAKADTASIVFTPRKAAGSSIPLKGTSSNVHAPRASAKFAAASSSFVTSNNSDEKSEDRRVAQLAKMKLEMNKLGIVEDEAVQVMTDNLNGQTLASDAEVAAGYIDKANMFHVFREHMADIPVFNPDQPHVGPVPGTEQGGASFPPSFMMNWLLNCYMRAGADAAKITAKIVVQQYIKLVVMYSGVFTPSIRARKVFNDEYRYHNVADVDIKETASKVLAFKKDAKVEQQLRTAGANVLRVVGTVVHMFRTRNHHYLESADDFITKTYSAAWNGTPDMFGMSGSELFRESIHCAGMYPLVSLMERARAMNVMPAALVIRLSAARAGTAAVRVTAAAIKTMKSEPFYEIVEKQYKNDIDLLMTHDEDLAQSGDHSHINHYYFSGYNDRGIYNESVIHATVCLAVGYIQSLDKGATLKQQKVLVKRVSNFTAIVKAYKEAFENYREDKIMDASLEDLLKAFKPSF